MSLVVIWNMRHDVLDKRLELGALTHSLLNVVHLHHVQRIVYLAVTQALMLDRPAICSQIMAQLFDIRGHLARVHSVESFASVLTKSFARYRMHSLETLIDDRLGIGGKLFYQFLTVVSSEFELLSFCFYHPLLEKVHHFLLT